MRSQVSNCWLGIYNNLPNMAERKGEDDHIHGQSHPAKCKSQGEGNVNNIDPALQAWGTEVRLI